MDWWNKLEELDTIKLFDILVEGVDAVMHSKAWLHLTQINKSELFSSNK